MPVFDALTVFLVVLPIVLYIPAMYYCYKFAVGKGVRRFFLLFVAVLLLFLRRVSALWEYSLGFAPNIIDALFVNLVAASFLIAARELNKSLAEIFKPIIQVNDKERLAS